MGRLDQKEQAGEQPIEVAEIGVASILERTLGHLSEADFYTLAEFVFNARVEDLKQLGKFQRLPEIVSEEQLDDHFDELDRLYRQTCQELGLAWPPPAIDDAGFERTLDREGQEVAAAEVEHLRQPFVVASVCREDLRGILLDEELATLSDNDMARIVDRMGDVYRDSGSCRDSLEVMTGVVIRRKEQG